MLLCFRVMFSVLSLAHKVCFTCLCLSMSHSLSRLIVLWIVFQDVHVFLCRCGWWWWRIILSSDYPNPLAHPKNHSTERIARASRRRTCAHARSVLIMTALNHFGFVDVYERRSCKRWWKCENSIRMCMRTCTCCNNGSKWVVEKRCWIRVYTVMPYMLTDINVHAG